MLGMLTTRGRGLKKKFWFLHPFRLEGQGYVLSCRQLGSNAQGGATFLPTSFFLAQGAVGRQDRFPARSSIGRTVVCGLRSQ